MQGFMVSGCQACPGAVNERPAVMHIWKSTLQPCAGLMYLRLPLDTPTAAYNRSAALWIAMFAFTLMPSETACSVWCQERAVVRACTPLSACLNCV